MSPDPDSCSRWTARPRPPCSGTARASPSSGCPRAAGSSTRPSRSTALDDPVAAIRHALRAPGRRPPPAAGAAHGRACSSPSASTTSRLPLPPMRAPDVRQMVIERCSTWRPRPGVDDVVLVAALALHRRMTEAELRHALGDRVYDAFAPHGLLTQHDAEDPDNLIHLGPDRPGRGRRDQQAGRHQRPARLREHQPGGHGRRAQERGHRPGQLPQPAPPPQPAAPCSTRRSFMDAPASELHYLQLAHGPAIAEAGSRSSRSRPRSTPTPSRRNSPSCSGGSGSGRCGTGPPTPPPLAALDATPATAVAARSSTRSEPPTP